jgi:hypothetical protein
MSTRRLQWDVVMGLAMLCFLALETRVSADGKRASDGEQDKLFSPSNATTDDGRLIPAEEFFPAARCATCHHDTHSAWSESLHRNGGREPFYKKSANILQRTRGNQASQHCESCHSPIAVVSGALLAGGKDARTEDEGVSCAVCHSIIEARVDGTGSYTIRRPALLVHEDGTPVFGDLPNAAILADIPSHRRAMMRPLLRALEFCAACHKSTAPPELNGYKFLRNFSAYDEWQQSGASHQTITAFYRLSHQVICQACPLFTLLSSSGLQRETQSRTIMSNRLPDWDLKL